MPKDPELRTHLEWLGYLQPVGLVVSPPALVSAQAFPAKNILPEHSRFLEIIEEMILDGETDPRPAIRDFPRFATHILGWEPADILGTQEGGAVPENLEVPLPVYNETLRPTYAVPEFDKSADAERKWLLLIQRVSAGLDLDATPQTDAKDHRWQASPQARFERLLRETGVPIGLLVNDIQIRLVYAPRGETSGHVTFPVHAMTEVSGRPIFAALLMLLSAPRLFTLTDKQRLPAILAESRKYQNLVSTQLAEQVLAALYELVRGFQAADEQRHGDLLRAVLENDPNHVYAGLLTVLLRLVFLLYAEDRSLLSSDEVYQKYYSVSGLFERLRADAGRYFDTMDQRYGAWAQLLTLFRLIHDGGRHGALQLPPRKGYLFDPERYPFLEGRQRGERIVPPRVADGVVYRVLQNLLILDGERLSYRSLDVEQIGSVYETMMGFDLEAARGRSIAIKPSKAHGAPASINLEELLAVKPAERAKWLKEQTDQKLTGQAATALKEARTPEDAVAALEKKVAQAATPYIVAAGAMVLQPSDERRRSGSHYTPRSLTEPIVRTTLRPILERLGAQATPEQILALKICDPAMGSGAFLVEACRQLGDALVKAWHLHDRLPRIPPDEDAILHARRLIAQRCLYGVDKNPLAVDLSKLSLWLATLAKDHPFTFLDHALRCGDSLVGLTRKQIVEFHWLPTPQRIFGQEIIEDRVNAATRVRQEIIEAGDEVAFALKQQKLALAEESLSLVRFTGNLVIAAFFAGDNDKKRKAKREELLKAISEYLRTSDMQLRPTKAEEDLRSGEKGIQPFHWEIEFPEVFGRENGGFDGIIGNPPFAGKNTIIDGHAGGYLDWLKMTHAEAHGNSDLVAHFFRRAFHLLRSDGAFGLIATNTIAQGDTRTTGLRWICTHGGTIYTALRRLKWPGQAAVVVSVVHVLRAATVRERPILDGKPVAQITAYLFHAGGHENPATLKANADKSFQGSIVLGMGFTFDDTDRDGVASPLAEMHRLIEKDPKNDERIFPYIGGEEVNDSPTHSHHRYVINFGEMTEEQARQWPDLMAIVETKVKPERLAQKDSGAKEKWWQFIRPRGELAAAICGLERVLVIARVGQTGAFTLLPAGTIYSEQLVVISLPSYATFCTLQSRVHEIWARFFGSSMKDDLRYTPSDCFETFPFPEGVLQSLPDARGSALESIGKEYYEFRAALMVQSAKGLTKTYNRFHDPDEPSCCIARLRQLHAAMDRAVLDAYGWSDLQPVCEFLLDYTDEEDADADERPAGRGRKKPWRYRWPDDFRDTVLARLLELNKQRAQQEALAGAEDKPKKGRGKKAKRQPPESTGLF